MIDNSATERNVQKGLKDENIVYEIEVEFPFTRFMAIYLNNQDTIIGPIRSSRYYFSRISNEWYAIFAHCGGDRLDSQYIYDLDEMVYPSFYWRDEKIGGWINLFTNIQMIRKQIVRLEYYKNDYDSPTFFKNILDNIFYNNNPIMKGHMQRMTIKYHSGYVISYVYNPEEKNYWRYVNGQAHIDQNTMEQIQVSNILIQYASTRKNNEDTFGRIQVESVAEGFGKLIHSGQSKAIKWTKNDLNKETKFLDSYNNPIVFFPGNIWIHVLSADKDIWIK